MIHLRSGLPSIRLPEQAVWHPLPTRGSDEVQRGWMHLLRGKRDLDGAELDTIRDERGYEVGVLDAFGVEPFCDGLLSNRLRACVVSTVPVRTCIITLNLLCAKRRAKRGRAAMVGSRDKLCS